MGQVTKKYQRLCHPPLLKDEGKWISQPHFLVQVPSMGEGINL